MFPWRGAVVAATGSGNGWPLGAALASDLGAIRDARPVVALPAFRELAHIMLCGVLVEDLFGLGPGAAPPF